MARDRGGRSSRRARSSKREEVEEAEDIQEAEDASPSGGSGRRRKSKKAKGKGKGKKRIDVMPIIMVGMLLVAVGAVVAYFPMQKRMLMQAVSGGGRLGFDAAREVAKSPSAIPALCATVESSASGRMAAAAGLAKMARRGEPGAVIGAIQARLKGSIPADAVAAYAAALAQSRCKEGEQAAAALGAGSSPEVRRTVVRALAHGTTPAATQAVGRALGDADPEVRRLAKAAVEDWAATEPKRAVEAASAALALEDDSAHVAAAEMLLATAGDVGPESVLPLLASESSQVREFGLRAATRSGLMRSGNADLAKAVCDLVDVDDQPPPVKLAALDAAAAGNVADAGPKALEILERDPDDEVRARAATTIAATQPEGFVEALTAPLLQDERQRDVCIACVLALSGRGMAIPDDKLVLVAGALIGLARRSDETLAGLSLMALKQLTGKGKSDYTAAQWEKYVARRAFEILVFKETKDLFGRMKKEYEEKKDDAEAVERIWKTIEKAGLELQEKLFENADPDDKTPMDAFITRMVRYNKKIRGLK